MKIAAVSENGTTLSKHFGKAPFYIIMTVEDKKVISKEKRMRAAQNICGCGHNHGEQGHQHGTHEHCGGSHSEDAASQSKHAGMAQAISDCQVLIAGGMGFGAYQSLKKCRILPIITDVENIDEAVQSYLEGKLVNLMDRLH